MARFFGTSRGRGQKKERKRFRRPEFQKKLAQARFYTRKTEGKSQKGKGRSARLNLLGSRVGLAAATLVAAVLVYFLAASDLFLVTKAQVEGGDVSKQEAEDVLQQIGSRRFLLIAENHFLLLSRRRFEQRLKDEIPQVRTVSSYQRVFPDRVRISVEKRAPSFVWVSGGQHYLLDQGGEVYQEILNYDPAVYPQLLITDTLGGSVVVGEDLQIEAVLDFINETKKLQQDLVPQIVFAGAILPGPKSVDLFLETDVGFQVFFDLKRDPVVQVENLKLLLDQQIEPGTLQGLSYIDLRLPDLAYYCYRDAPCALEAEENQNLESKE